MAQAKEPALQQLALREGSFRSTRLDYLSHKLENSIPDITELADLFDQSIKEGLCKPIIVPELMIMMVHGGTAGLLLTPLREHEGLPEITSETQLRETVDRIVGIYLSGVLF